MFHLKKFTFNIASENTYILYNDEKNAWLFDPGNMNDAENKQIESFIKENELKITKILLTHAHFDHILGLQWAVDVFQLPVHMHKDDKEILDMLPMSTARFGISTKPINANIEYLEENEVLDFDGEKFKIYHVPGHSPGSIVFHNEEQKFMISGDVLFEGSIGRTDLPKGDYEQLISGITNKLLILEDETQVFSGHGNPTTIGFERQYNPFLK